MRYSVRAIFNCHFISAKEVIQSIPQNSSLDQLLMRQSHVNLSTVRAKYRNERRAAR